MDRIYRRHLPHWHPEGVPIFVTWNLKGAMPAEAAVRLRQERDRLTSEPPRSCESPTDRAIREAKVLFGLSDAILDRSTTGPLWLKDSQASQLVERSILFGTPRRYDLFAWCIMANHVHILIRPAGGLSRVMQGLKGYTARQINTLDNAKGRILWQDESYDHWVRDEDELHRIIHYIEHNPVTAGLCTHPQNWPWSSARLRTSWPRGEPFQPEHLT